MQTTIIQQAGDKITVPVVEINIDDDIMTSVTHGVRGVPTMILKDDNDQELKRHVGLMKEKELIEWLKP
jgi:thioredoxin-like negative regulator of GroEL